MKKIIIIIVSVGCILVFTYGLLWVLGGVTTTGFFNRQINHTRMKNIFVEDYVFLRKIVDYFIYSEHTSFFIRFEDDFDDVLINNDDVVIALETLRARGYFSIHRQDNIIYFQRSSRGRHFGNGIVYSIDGVEPNYGVNPRSPFYGSAEEPTQIMFLTKLEPLIKSNWFYYEADFREWRLRYR